MNPRNLTIGVIFCGLLLVLAIYWGSPAKDPLYQGKPLSYWLKESEQNILEGASATSALRHYGRDAEPLLKEMLRARDTKLRFIMRLLLTKQSPANFKFEPASVLQLRALRACNVLGADVSGTVPAIAALPDSDNGYFVRIGFPYSLGETAVTTLAVMGPAGIDALVQELGNTNPSVCIRAAELLATAPGSATPAVSAALRQCVNGVDDGLKATAARSLELLQKRLDQRIPSSATNLIESADAASPNGQSVWDFSTGMRILSDSGMIQGQGTWRPEDLFGAHLSHTPNGESGTAIFNDSRPDGFVHFIEWETPEPVTIRSFGFIAGHDTPENGFQRALRTFRLYARTNPADDFKCIYSEELSVPYGQGYCSVLLVLFRNLEAPVTARQFRAEFVQNGAGANHGPRVIELYGFGNPLNWPLISTALQNQDPDIQSEARRVFSK